MCGRFINLTTTKLLKKKFNINNSLTENFLSYNIFPSQFFLIIYKDKEINIDKAKWGYPFQDKSSYQEKIIINSRLETIKDKIIFKESYFKRKCILSINGYYEWSMVKNKKTPFFIHIPQSEPMYLAGIWKYNNYENDNQKFFTVITKNANTKLSHIHHRMPVILSIEESEEYLNNQNSTFLNNDYSSDIETELDFYPVSKFVNNPLNNSKECIKSINN